MLVSWNTTNACNLACAHCYRDAGARAKDELDTREGKALIDEIAKAGFKIMIFSGGEPLMRPDIYELIAYASEKGLRPVLGSNGTLITPEVGRKLVEAGARAIGISIDSVDPEAHDRFRAMPGSWQAAVDGMKNCQAVGLPFQIHTTVMDWNYEETEALTDLAVGLGAMAHHVFFLVPTGRGKDIENTTLREVEYEKLLRRILNKQKQVAIELKPTCAPQFMRVADQVGVETRFKRGCLAGLSYCLINPVGEVQPCAYMQAKIGNVRETPFSELWRNAEVFKRLRTRAYSGRCGSCDYGDRCGGCRARAEYYHGDYMAEEPWCLYHRGGKAANATG
ncbi:MAG: putative heme d1 biosynthesis radical SAM protein NirJ2 [Eubacteriales bacterium]|nr:putative heme d1 biosynthesis radical SAM protein NirJ2 [Bacillota bacterium]MBV1727048.1 putative heme d1 biosynthesis radical SAM protein NirJ2 [Desulforudis sp.]MDP3049952.1 putative heme d1 biosynthesis radical SAM protein NirJ2 [Eubacteriales bacterium]MDQ7789168.1 putative heme d1 biosynthesis radical SAM protein NirJ2 [Clostridia bacterium]MBU4533102.1 putative heme d1 biosynthesis radical SAM protein NirJ2 [Bacillota bacterium]